MRPFTIFAVLAAFVLTACAPTASAPAAVQEHVARLWTEDTRTVLSGDGALGLTHQCSRIAPGPIEGQWAPSPAQLDELESALIQLVSQELEEAGMSPSPGNYYRQYAGFVIGGRRVIYVNGFGASLLDHEPNPYHPFDWRTQSTQICDGGPITFGVEYDPVTRRFANFSFNGTAGGPFPPRR